MNTTAPETPLRVRINDIEYAPLHILSQLDCNNTAKALLRMCVSGYYTTLHCHATGGEPNYNCDCSGCHGFRMIEAFLGGGQPCSKETDEGFRLLESATY